MFSPFRLFSGVFDGVLFVGERAGGAARGRGRAPQGPEASGVNRSWLKIRRQHRE